MDLSSHRCDSLPGWYADLGRKKNEVERWRKVLGWSFFLLKGFSWLVGNEFEIHSQTIFVYICYIHTNLQISFQI